MYGSTDKSNQDPSGSYYQSSSTATNNFLDDTTSPKYYYGRFAKIFVAVASLSLLCTISIFFLSSKSSSLSSLSSLSTSDEGRWQVYKHTVAIASGKYSEVQKFVNTYITDAQSKEIMNLGCDTAFRVVATLSAAVAEGFGEIHWVDSAMFPQSGLTLGEWATYIDGLGTEKFNAFMHNKVQLFVPNLSPHFNALLKDGINVILRLSTSSDDEKVAHIGIPVPYTSHM